MTTSHSPKYDIHGDNSYLGIDRRNVDPSAKRENLLLKCKGAIEELHMEIEQLHNEKRRLEERIVSLEKENLEKEARLSEKADAAEKKVGTPSRNLSV